ncbi:PQQ-dependent sugar dehydrogenase [Limibaculum sp. M0105]|uniref:PQQ-dependent sugar dehydrogenase n=1 Tax=Thermohalobaculum xanthum TaxID=2753746 RepID=A0A8J7M3N8_9RHOB|nr:PQQ-dependent sugar dehydrogenase [Thermohalobaculum xanthum]MBK0397746.1 PQQ-dependent sugar dehydrogenase [Thermohalobaculum xanthum]
MRLLRLASCIALGLGLAAGGARAETFDTSAGPVEVTRIVSGLDTPWAVAFLPGGNMLITERDGKLLHLDAAGQRIEVDGVPAVRASGQGGLLDVVAANDFARSREIFLTYSEPAEGGAHTAVAVARLSEDAARLENLRVIFRMTPTVSGGRHFGSRVVERADGTLFVTLGERGQDTRAQDVTTHLGKVVRINRDGSIPSDNPDFGPGAAPGLWSIGHRNPQGAALDAEGRLWTVAHGARGGDEINRPEAGRNYGWPVITFGRAYSGLPIGEGTHKEGMEQPVTYWDPSIAPSGMAILSGRMFPGWEGDIFVGSLKDDYVSRLDREGDRVTSEEGLFRGAFARIRDVREGPDGALWFLSEGDGALYRVTPAD